MIFLCAVLILSLPADGLQKQIEVLMRNARALRLENNSLYWLQK